MVGTTSLWVEHWDLIYNSEFSLIAARLLHEEMDSSATARELKECKRRHNRHVRAGMKYLRKAKRIRRKIKRYEEKYARLHQSDHSNE